MERKKKEYERLRKFPKKKNLNQTGSKTIPTKKCLFRHIATENLSMPKLPFLFFLFIFSFIKKTIKKAIICKTIYPHIPDNN